MTSAALLAQRGPRADLILTNGRIYTVDAATPWAEAIAISGSRILAVGTVGEAQAHAGPQTRSI
ncbi:MAG: hypothetical protein H0W53_16200, partial [Acidobacteria bacterium]|nr:hypothetical protein [Acidobacteriota bacterium]